MNKRWTLEGKKALITGGTKGIGVAIANEFLALGAEIFVISRNIKDIDEHLSLWKADGYKCQGLKADVSIDSDRKLIFETINSLWGKLDILVNNAGTNIRKKTMDYSDEEFSFLFETNYNSIFHLSKLFYPLLKASQDSSIVNIGSIAGSRIVSTGSIYAVTKAAIAQLTRYLAVEWAEDGIRVNAIEPWYIKTPLTQPVLDNPVGLARILDRTPLGKIGKPEDIAGLAAFLCMPTADYITGEVISVDGGAGKKTL